MQVVGLTTPHEIFIASKERKFRMNELLVIKDTYQGEMIGEVVESNSYNRFIPLSVDRGIADMGILESLKHLGYSIDEDEINIAKVKLLTEANFPIATGSKVRLPEFNEVKDYLIKGDLDDGLLLGEIKNTMETAATMEEELKGLFYMYTKGKVQKTKNVPFILDLRSFQQYPHIGIFGGSGSGKSFGLRVLLEEVMNQGFPALILDPHYEMDFADNQEIIKSPQDFNGKFEKLQIGEDIGVKFTNLTKGDIKALLAAVSPLSEAMDSAVDFLFLRGDTYDSFSNRLDLLTQALEIGRLKIENRLNQDLAPLERDRYMMMRQVILEYPNVPLPSVQAVAWRLRRLHSAGLFNHDINRVKHAMMQGKLVVIQGPIWLLQVFSTYLLSNLYRQRRQFKDGQLKGEPTDKYFPPFIIVTDEAHNFAPKGREAPTKRTITEIAQEGRKYGVFLVLATQRPTLLDETVTAQLNTKIIFRTVRASDIGTISEETDIKAEEARRLPYLPSGDAFVSSPVFGRTVAIRVRFPHTRSPHTQNPLDELKSMQKSSDDELVSLITPHLPIYAANFAKAVEDINSQSKIKYDVNALKSALDTLVQKGLIKKQDSPLGEIYR